MKLHESMEA